jgi:hypothetical protein
MSSGHLGMRCCPPTDERLTARADRPDGIVVRERWLPAGLAAVPTPIVLPKAPCPQAHACLAAPRLRLCTPAWRLLAGLCGDDGTVRVAPETWTQLLMDWRSGRRVQFAAGPLGDVYQTRDGHPDHEGQVRQQGRPCWSSPQPMVPRSIHRRCQETVRPVELQGGVMGVP